MNLQDTKAHTQEWQKKKIHSQTVDDGTESFFWFAFIYNSLLTEMRELAYKNKNPEKINGEVQHPHIRYKYI